jgi:large subunit ribosomal protein L21
MYAIVSIAGQQFKVEKGKKVFVHRLPGNVGDEVSFDKVLLISNDDKVNVGAPYLSDAVVLAEILSHDRGDKVLVFKRKEGKRTRS